MSGKADKSTWIFKKLIEIEPSGRTYAYLGLSYCDLGRFDEARQYFQQGLKLDPHNSSCLFNLGLIAERQGDPRLQRSYFRRYFSTTPITRMHCWSWPICEFNRRNYLRPPSC